MISGVYQNAASINALQSWNDVISQNIAAASRPGYKGKAVSFEAALTGGPGSVGSDGMPSRMPRPVTRTVFAQGEVRTTGLETDFAIKGSGFFQLARPDGQMVYTRDGGFILNRERTLVNKEGFSVMGVGGPIQLLPEGGVVTMEEDGTLRQGDQEVGRLSLVEFTRPDWLIDVSGGMAIDPDRPQFGTAVPYPQLVQGAIESSNVSSIHEMVDMITVNNAFQANQRVISSIDRAMERAVEILGNT
ncbi:MAG: flagellar hook-basal body protein [Opitutaceae bacterium]